MTLYFKYHRQLRASITCLISLIALFELSAQPEKKSFYQFGVKDGLPEEWVLDIIQDEQGFMWMATQNGLVKYDGYEFTVFRPDPKDSTGVKVSNFWGGMLKSRDGRLWMGGAPSNVISVYDPELDKFRNIYMPDEQEFEPVLQLVDFRNSLWFRKYFLESDLNQLCIIDPTTYETECLRYEGDFFEFMGPYADLPLAESKTDSSIWILGDSHVLYKWKFDLEEIKAMIPAGSVLSDQIGADTIKTINSDSTGLLLLSGNLGLYVYDPVKEKVLNSYDFSDQKLNHIETEEQHAFHAHRKYWVLRSEFISIIDPESGHITTKDILIEADYFGEPSIESIEYSKLLTVTSEGVWLNPWTGFGSLSIPYLASPGFLYVDKNLETVKHFDEKFNDEKNEEINTNYLGMTIDRSGITWIRTRGSFHRESTKLRQIDHFTENNSRLPSNAIYYMMEDDQQRLWIGTMNGIALFNGNADFMNISVESSSLQDQVARKIIQDHDNRIWAIVGDKLFRFDETGLTFQQVTIPRIRSHRIINLIPDGSGLLWLSIQGYGVLAINQGTGKITKDFEVTPDANHGLKDVYNYSMFVDSKGHLWLGDWGYNVGVHRYNSNTDSFVHYSHNNADSSSLSNNEVRFIGEDNLGRIWIGTDYHGVNVYREETDDFICIEDEVRLKSATGFANAANGSMWISTYVGGGLAYVNPDLDSVSYFGEKEGLTHNDASLEHGDSKVRIDSEGRIWLPNRRGLSVFDTTSRTFKNFFEYDGFQPYGRGNFGTLIRSNGEVWIGGEHGLNRIDPNRVFKKNNVPPQVWIKEIDIANTKYTKPDGTIFTKAISQTDQIELAYWQKDLQFKFVALHYLRPEDNLYSWKLESYDEEWSAPSTTRIASYTNLSPGTYTLRVKGANTDGIWNEEGDFMVIKINPPIWLTGWAYGLYAVLFFGLLGFIRYYEKKRWQLKQEAKNLAKLDQLKSDFFSNISHEFRTPLTLIKGPLKTMYDGTFKGNPKRAFGLMLRNVSRLQQLINQLLDISKIESGSMAMHVEKVEIVGFLRTVAAMFESYADERNITVSFFSEIARLDVYIDQDKARKIFYNLISNAIKFSPENESVLIQISVDSKKDQLYVAVQDNGSGISEAEQDKIFDRFYQVDNSSTRKHEGTGLGMSIAKEMVELHHGEIQLSSAEGVGTTFKVILPLGKTHFEKQGIEFVSGETEHPAELEPTLAGEAEAEDEIKLTEDELTDHEAPSVLVIEDNKDMQTYIKSTIEPDYTVDLADNGKIGIDIAFNSIPDIVVSDVMMPEMDGFEVLSRLKTDLRTNHIPVILLTAKADDKSKLKGLKKEADAYLTKPFDSDELVATISNLIRIRQKIQDKYKHNLLVDSQNLNMESLDEKFLKSVVDTVEDNLSDFEFGSKELAEELSISKVHLYRKIKALTGFSPSQFLNTIRLRRAETLLVNRTDSISQIAYSVGFNNLSYFNRRFKELYKKSPSEYQKSHFEAREKSDL